VRGEASAVALLPALLAGCDGVCALPEARGGTAIERAIVDAEADAFVRSLIPEICVPSMKIIDVTDKDYEGAYNVVRRSIKIGAGLDEPRLREVVRHELCHAAHHQGDIDVDGPPWTIPPGYPVTERREGNEAFALTCSAGPLEAHVYSGSCEDDFVDGPDIWALTSEHFRVPDEPVDREVDYVEVGSLSLAPAGEEGGRRVRLQGTVEGALRIELVYGDQVEVRYLDPWTGEPASLGTPVVAPPVAEVEPPTPHSQVFELAEADGAELLEVHTFAVNLSGKSRLLFRDADGVTPVCRPDGNRLFAAGGDLWSWFLEEDRVRWGVWQVR
jgi:hypothetical protein